MELLEDSAHTQMKSVKTTCQASLCCRRQLDRYPGIQDQQCLSQPVVQLPSIPILRGHQLSGYRILKREEDCLSRQVPLMMKTETRCWLVVPWALPLLYTRLKGRAQGRANSLGLFLGHFSPICCRKAGTLALCVLRRGHLKRPHQCQSN